MIIGEVLDFYQHAVVPISSHCKTIDVDILLQKFWELDEIATHKNVEFADDEAEKHFHVLRMGSKIGRKSP